MATAATAPALSSSSSPALQQASSFSGDPSSGSAGGGGGSGGAGSSGELTDPARIREWLPNKQLALLDRFLQELRLGRLSSTVPSADPKAKSTTLHHTGVGTGIGSQQASSEYRLLTALRTVELLRHLVGSTRWKSAAQLLVLLRGLGREFQLAAGGASRVEPVVGNVVRRIMAAVREEAVRTATLEDAAAAAGSATGSSGASSEATTGGRLSLQSMLWALPQHVRSKKPSFAATIGDHQRQESFASEADLAQQQQQQQQQQGGFGDYPPSYYARNRPDLKQSILEAIQEIINEMDDTHRNINDQAAQHIHSDEIILTVGYSKTVADFLKFAKLNKKRQFQVVVCESAPRYGGHAMALELAAAGIDTLVIADAAIFAMMARVNKVLVPAHAVLANGGLVASSGCNVVALAAHHNSVPVVCVTGLFKLCPMYPHENQDTLNDLLSPNDPTVVEYDQLQNPLWRDVELINPVHDYIKPGLVSLYITNVGSFQPSFTYRLLAEYYHVDDWESFD